MHVSMYACTHVNGHRDQPQAVSALDQLRILSQRAPSPEMRLGLGLGLGLVYLLGVDKFHQDSYHPT